MLSLLKKYFGYNGFRPLQREIIENVLNKKDTFVLMPTGGGKSLCYQLPALKLAGLTIVVSPLISLMKDQVDALQANGIAAEFINSSLSYQEIVRRQNLAKKNEIKILYLAPERLALSNFRNYLKTLKIDLIAIDEAHCISQWGHDFRPEYRNLKYWRQLWPQTPIIALTATATSQVQADIIEQLNLNQPQIFSSSFDRPNLKLAVMAKKNAFAKLLALAEKHRGQAVIIYCFSRQETENLAIDLKAEGFSALPYHAGLDSKTRNQHQDLFIKDEVNIIIATIAFGLGIDKPDIRLIVHYTFPKTLESYYQEIGRAGRDGLPSDCITFYSYVDKLKHEYFIRQIADPIERQSASQKLEQIIQYCQEALCRRRQILSYFGEHYPLDNCQRCDICLNPPRYFEATEISQKIMSAILRAGSRFGKKYIAQVLTGSRDKKIINNQHQRLSVFGLVNDFTVDQLIKIINQLIMRGLLRISQDQYPILSLTPAGAVWLKQRQTLTLPQITEYHLNETEEIIEYDQELFNQLRILRKQEADKRHLPPFVIFSDQSLQEMACYLPQSQEDFSRIFGVGSKKTEDFAKIFLDLIIVYSRAKNFQPKKIPARRLAKIRSSLVAGDPRYAKTKQMVLQKFSLTEMAHRHNFAESTIINHLEKLLAVGEKLDLEHLLPPAEQVQEIEQAFLHCGDEFLRPIYEFLQERYSYEKIKLVGLWRKSKS